MNTDHRPNGARQHDCQFHDTKRDRIPSRPKRFLFIAFRIAFQIITTCSTDYKDEIELGTGGGI